MKFTMTFRKQLTLFMLLVFVGGMGYLYRLNRSVKRDLSKIQYLDEKQQSSPSMIESKQKVAIGKLLLRAIQQDDVKALSRLLDQEVSSEENVGGQSLAFRAVSTGAVRTLALLLKRGADTNTADAEGTTLLMEAVKRGNPVIIKLLMAHGAKLNAVDNRGRTILMYAAGAYMSGAPSVSSLQPGEKREVWDMQTTRQILLPVLASGVRVDAVDREGVNAMRYAAEYGSSVLISFLLDKGANPDDALCGVVSQGDVALLRRLLAKGAQVNRRLKRADARYTGGMTALGIAKHMEKEFPERGYGRVIELLLKAGARE